jgi:hypothetical protein
MNAQNITKWCLMTSERTIHDWADWALKAILVGIVAVSVNYLRSVADHISSLDLAVTEIKHELRTHSSVQSLINDELKTDVSRINNRIDFLEKSCSRRKQ